MTLHSYGIYQSDIKPPNIAFYRHTGIDQYEAKLIDFGTVATNYSDINGYSPFYIFNGKARNNLGGLHF